MPTGVAEAPAVIHGTVQEVNIRTRVDSDGRQAAGLCVRVHTLDYQHSIVDTVIALEGIPAVNELTVFVSKNTCKTQCVSDHVYLYNIHSKIYT